MSNLSTDDFDHASQRFETSLIRLEAALAASVVKIAQMEQPPASTPGASPDHDVDVAPLLRDELAAARARASTLQEAVDHAKQALDAAIDDIREVLGPV